MMPLKCPVCGAALDISAAGASCPAGHAFDRAAAGYLNLLLAQNKHARQPGDDREMVLARRRFLNAGYYAPLRDALCERVARYRPDTLVDAGCGEGYYTAALSACAGQVIGVDLSKDAVLRAAKRDKKGMYCVGSIFDLPVLDASAQVITSIFAPYSAPEFARVARRAVIAVIPGAQHLWGLKQALYATPYPNDEQGYTLPGFALADTQCVDFTIRVEGAAAISDLFHMTPYYWKTPRDAAERLALRETLSTPVSFRILSYEKQA